MAELRIKIRREYEYDGEFKEAYRCRVYFFLPARNGEIIEQLRNENVRLLGEKLYSTWGFMTDDEEWRYRKEIVSADNWKDLKAKAEEMENDIISTLKKIKEKYEEAITNKPEDSEVIVVL